MMNTEHITTKGNNMVTVTADRVLLKLIKVDKKSTGGIVMLTGIDNPNEEAEVIQVGEGARTKTGVLIPPAVKPGDHILLMPGVGVPIKVNGEELVVVKEEDIIAIMGNNND